MATIIYDGKSNVTAAVTDTVIITADPTLFTQGSETGGGVALRFGANTLTVTGATLTTDPNIATSLKNVSLAGGNFAVATAGTGAANSAASSLIVSTDASNAGQFITGTTTADSKNAFFGGSGISSPNDGADSVQIGGKGSFLVYGNGGADVVTQNAAAFDSTSAVTIFGGKGNDAVTLGNTDNKASLLVYGGEGTDNISVFNTGNTTIFGGLGAGDSADGADNIAFTGVSGGTINVFGNGGNDIISGAAGTFGTATTFANNTVANIFGGTGSDSINIGFNGTAKGTVTVYGGEDGDRIQVVNTGTTTIYGGTGQGDSTDGADSIGLGQSGGTISVFGNAGNDVISGDGTAGTATSFADSTNAQIFGGKGSDTINVAYSGTNKGVLAVFGGEDTDTITVSNGVGGSTTVFGGTGQGDSADGADTINVLGSGAVNVFGNGGSDTINLGSYTGGTASTNVVTVYGGTGNDSINVGAGSANKTFNLNGNEGNDTFVIGTSNIAEVDSVVFGNGLANSQSITVNGVTLTAAANGTASAADVANFFLTGTTPAGTTGSGTATLPFTVTAGANSTTLTYTNTNSDGTNVAVTSTGATAPTVSETTNGVQGTSGVGTGITISDFTVGSDVLSINNGTVANSPASLAIVPNGGFNTLQDALNAASQGAQGSVSVVAFQGSTYVVTANSGTTGFQAGTDVAVKLTGVTDVNGVAGGIVIV